MNHAPASGEREALRGYHWQYDHIAALTYDSLLAGDFVTLRLTDPEVGRVDDLVLIRQGRADGYQFKSSEAGGYITFRRIEQNQTTHGGNVAPSLLQSLAEGWMLMRRHWENAHVHFVTQQLASVNDHLGVDGSRPHPDNFRAFIAEVLEPLKATRIALKDVGIGWQPALRRFKQACGVESKAIEQFLQSVHFHFGAGSGRPVPSSIRRSDIIALSSTLMRLVSESSDVVELDKTGVLELMGWADRLRLKSRHEFPVDLDTYEPLQDAINELKGSIGRQDNGYIALIGPPGTGKSTLLSQALTGTDERVVRYYTYVPGSPMARTRATAQGFLHDIVVMLNKSGLGGHDREFVSEDIHPLRRQLTDQLAAAGEEFKSNGRRTLIVVDGLDHVARENLGADALLAELPRPSELPQGVLLIIGSRTIEPLNAHARQQLAEQHAIVDLGNYPLPTASVFAICRRAPITASLESEVHQRIVELSNGHPLALSYLLNRLRDSEDRGAEQVLANMPAYAGDVGAEYLAVWDEVCEDDDVVDILAVCSRLRIGFTTRWLFSWAPTAAVRFFRRKLLYLFRYNHDGWRFFHDSFRQFVSDQTALGDETFPHSSADALAHQRIADLCARTEDSRIAAEQLYHRYWAHQYNEVLGLAEQATLREQYKRLRSPDLIAADISLALTVAANRADILTMLRMVLALAEVNERNSTLEGMDVPGLLFDVGLIDEALGYCGTDGSRGQLAHAYKLAARLGAENEAAGRRFFDLVPLDDPGRDLDGDEEDSTAVAWVRAAVMYRPLPVVINAIRRGIENPLESDRQDSYWQTERWRRYGQMMMALVDSVALRSDGSELTRIDITLAEQASKLMDEGSSLTKGLENKSLEDDFSDRIAMVTDIRVRLHRELLRAAKKNGDVAPLLDALMRMLSGKQIFAATALDAAELLEEHSKLGQAMELLRRTPYDGSLTVSALTGLNEDDSLNRRFRYWRLRHLIASDKNYILESSPPPIDRPEGANVPVDAATHRDIQAIKLAAQIDSAIRHLAALDAAAISGQKALALDAWSALNGMLDLFQSSETRNDPTLSLIAGHKRDLMQIITAVALNYGQGIPQKLSRALTRRFKERPDRWPPRLRLDLAEQLRFADIDAPWRQETLINQASVAKSLDLHSRLDELSSLARRYASDGELQTARVLVLQLIQLSFGVGYRKDHQFDTWVAWLGRTLSASDGSQFVEDAAWLARLLRATKPMTEGAPGSAAARLPAAVVPADPMAAVRIFEYLVRNGTAHHLNVLASLVRLLVAQDRSDGKATVKLAADMVAHILAPAANRSYPDLTTSLITAAECALGQSAARGLAESVADRIDRNALPTTRREWREGLGLAGGGARGPDDDEQLSADDDFGDLILCNGRRIPRTDVPSLVQTADDIVALRQNESQDSYYSWMDLIDGQPWTRDEVKRLTEVFGNEPRDIDVKAALAQVAGRNGDWDAALKLAKHVLLTAPDAAWSSHWGGARLRAASVMVLSGDKDARLAACQDLTRRVANNRWLSRLLFSDFAAIVEILDPSLNASSIWPEIRTYLEGMAENVDLDDSDPLIDHGCRWWLSELTGDRRADSEVNSPATALAELAVGHLSHPTWLIRDAASTVVVGALVDGNEEIEKALGRFALPDASDDILERAGRCLAAAAWQEGYVVPAALEDLDRTLFCHPSQIIRDLCTNSPESTQRALAPVYRLALPAPRPGAIGSRDLFPYPHEWQYEMLAKGLGLDHDTLLHIAGCYAKDALEKLPVQEAVKKAIERSDVKHTYPSEELSASRTAFGRVLADLKDAGLLDNAPPQVRHLLRTLDIELVSRTPDGRPSLVPDPPKAGHDQTTTLWIGGAEDRLEEYISAMRHGGRVLVAATSRLTVLNWGHLEEELNCGTTIGSAQPAEGDVLLRGELLFLRDLVDIPAGHVPAIGGPIVVQNHALSFHQIHAGWLAFRPDLAVKLDWQPDLTQPGSWRTATGELAVESIWWVDGWWGRSGPAFHDTEADGHAVVLTSQGLADLTSAFGDLVCHFALTRRGREDRDEVEPTKVTRSVPIYPPIPI